MPQCRVEYRSYTGPNKDAQAWIARAEAMLGPTWSKYLHQLQSTIYSDPLFNKDVTVYDQVCGNEAAKGIVFNVTQHYPNKSGTLHTKTVKIAPQGNEIEIIEGDLMRSDGKPIKDFSELMSSPPNLQQCKGVNYTVNDKKLIAKIHSLFDKIKSHPAIQKAGEMPELDKVDAKEISDIIDYAIQHTQHALKPIHSKKQKIAR